MSSGTRRELLGILRRESVRFGRFRLASGAISDVYVDARLTVLRSDAAWLVGEALLGAMDRAGWRPTAVGGLAAGAIPLTSSLVMAAAAKGRELNGFFVRKAAKEHGRGRALEGIEHPTGTAVILEDTASTGRSTRAAVEAARSAGLEVIGALALVDRDMGAAARLEEAGVPYRAVYRLDELTGAPSGAPTSRSAYERDLTSPDAP